MREQSIETLVKDLQTKQTIAWLEKKFEEQDKKCAESLGISLEEWRGKVEECKLESRRNAVVQCDALIDAGWKFELPSGSEDLEPWQWYWRRPPRRKGSKGMFFWSTNQAYMHLQRSLKCQ